MTNTKAIRLENTLLLLWFAINLGIGALTVHEYGMSIDEPNNYRYADDTLHAYPSFFGMRYEPNYDSSYDGHGPAFVTVAGIPIRMIQSLFPHIFIPDLWHFSYFITFQLTGLCLYWLTKRWFNNWTAWGILVLFSTQPLLLGHAFINPKDIPFMFLLTLSIVFGFRLVDSIEPNGSFVSLQRPVRALSSKFQEAEPQRRRKFLTYFVVALAGTLTLVIFSGPINALIEQAITFFYTARPDSWAGQLFASVAGHASNVSAGDYVIKALRLFRRAEVTILIAGGLFFLAYFSILISGTTLATLLRNMWKQQYKLGQSITSPVKSLRNSPHLGSLKTWFAEVFQALRNPQVILAGVAL